MAVWKLLEVVGLDVNLRIPQGSDWTATVNYEATDLSGASVASQVRNKFSDASPYTTITCTVTSTGAGTSAFTLSQTSATTAALTVPANAADPEAREVEVGPWDYEVTDSGGDVSRPIKRGRGFLNQEATK